MDDEQERRSRRCFRQQWSTLRQLAYGRFAASMSNLSSGRTTMAEAALLVRHARVPTGHELTGDTRHYEIVAPAGGAPSAGVRKGRGHRLSADVGDARVRLIKPEGADEILPVIVYMHGGGWVLGNAATHDRLVRELAVGAKAALAFVEYPNSPPEARYPVAIEQGYATAQWVAREGASKGLDGSRIAGVDVTTVRYDGTVHDFMLLNSLSQTRAARAAIDQATAFLRAALGTE